MQSLQQVGAFFCLSPLPKPLTTPPVTQTYFIFFLPLTLALALPVKPLLLLLLLLPWPPSMAFGVRVLWFCVWWELGNEGLIGGGRERRQGEIEACRSCSTATARSPTPRQSRQ